MRLCQPVNLYITPYWTRVSETDSCFRQRDLQTLILAVNRLLDCDRRVQYIQPLVDLPARSVDNGENLANILLTELPLG